jgi:hypothetical protein
MRFVKLKHISIIFKTNYNMTPYISNMKLIGGIMVGGLASSSVYRRFEPRSGQTKDYTIGIYCFFAYHAALRRKSNDKFVRNQDNVSAWGDMSIRGLLFQ